MAQLLRQADHGGQRAKGKGKYKYDLEMVTTVSSSDIKPTSEIAELRYD
jgi:hypothetical protein